MKIYLTRAISCDCFGIFVDNDEETIFKRWNCGLSLKCKLDFDWDTIYWTTIINVHRSYWPCQASEEKTSKRARQNEFEDALEFKSNVKSRLISYRSKSITNIKLSLNESTQTQNLFFPSRKNCCVRRKKDMIYGRKRKQKRERDKK